MAKTFNTSVPAILEPLWKALTSPRSVVVTPDGTIRLKKKNKEPKKPPKPDPDIRAIARVAENVALEQGYDMASASGQYFAFVVARNLAVGVIDPQFFRQCPVVSAQTMESTAVSVPDPDPPPYGYRTVNFLPTLPTYSDGTPTAQPPGYQGGKVGTHYEDAVLRWRKIQYECNAINEPDVADRVVMRWDLTIDAETSSRGSRPMFSLNIFGVIAKTGAPALTQNTPPILKKTQLYWRFAIPKGHAPFYHEAQVRKVVKALSRIAKKQGAGTGVGIILSASNRPMMGRGYNNNDFVETTLTGDPELWEIRPRCLVWHYSQGNAFRIRDQSDTVRDVFFSSPGFFVSSAGVATIQVNLEFSGDGPTSTLSFVAQPVGPWNHPILSGFSTNMQVRVISVACQGASVLLHVARSGYGHANSTFAILRLNIIDETAATVTTIATPFDCNPVQYFSSKSDYGAFGLQTDRWWTNPHVIWAQFDKLDDVVLFKYFENSYFPYGGGTGVFVGTTEIGIQRNGVTLSRYRAEQIAAGTFIADLDAYNDDGRIQGWDTKLGWLNYAKNQSQLAPLWNTRLSHVTSRYFYSGIPQQPDDANYPWAQLGISPIVDADGNVAMQLKFYRRTTAPVSGTPPFESAPWYILTDTYIGQRIGADSITPGVTHTQP